MIKQLFIGLILALHAPILSFGNPLFEAENMTLGGPYAGKISSPFSGIALYANGDNGTIQLEFPQGDGVYGISLTGASNNSNNASVSVYINGIRAKAFTFSGTTPTQLQADVTLTNLSGQVSIELRLETDNGSSDTFIDKASFIFKSGIVQRPAPVIPEQGAYYTNHYRNLFVEAGYTDNAVQSKLQSIWQQLFYGNASTQKLYYDFDDDEAYILDTGNDDVRSEGISYGMMICVQMDKKVEFDKLWTFAKNRMQHQTGARKGYFAWQVSTSGQILDANTASDGEEYIIMALMFAENRWGNGTGIYNYSKEANDILKTCMSKESPIVESITNMFNSTHKQVVFVPYATAASFTDPSYHLPSFYRLWALWAETNNTFWSEVADKSCDMFPLFAHPQTGLMPDYANFDGTPRQQGNHADFRFDAWRCILNIAMDYAWFKADNRQLELVNRIHQFFAAEGVSTHGNQYTLAGTKLANDHSPGLVACNAVGALASNNKVAWEFIDEFYLTAIPSGKYRYYDGLLYFMSYLHLSGNYKIYKPTVPTGLKKSQNHTQLFPNPASNTMQLLGNTNYSHYRITRAETGQLKKQGVMHQNTIDVSGLLTGVYILALTNQDTQETITRKFIKN
jgi:endo-1,4-beta-D-glucanase Y